MRSRCSSLRADRFWLISTNVDKKIASSDTISVSSPNGNLSNGWDDTTLKMIQKPNHTTCSRTNAIVPLNRVIASAASCSWVRRRRVMVLKGELGPRLKFTVPAILGSPGMTARTGRLAQR